MAISIDQLVHQLADSSLMSADEVAALIDSLPAEKKPQDGEQLAKELVRQKKLTAYQAQQIYAGKGNSLVLGNYVILDKLGQGGMGLVLKAEHRRMKRLVALKVLSPKVTKSPEALRRFQREVEAAARLTHPNIVIAHDADEAGGTHFFVMEYVDGTDLSSLVKKRGPLPLDQALDCILQAARGLQYAHENGVVHRDIKPANLLLDRRGTVKILDMGLARLDTAGAQQDQLTGSNQIMGTVDYMAPEQAMSTKHADARADIYSLGVTLWYLLTGRPLYAGETTVEKLMAHQTKPIPSLCDACPEVTPPLDAIFHRMVAKTPQDRYQTMAEVIAELEQCRSGSMAGPPVVSIATAEDARLDEFLRGMAAPSKQRAVPRQKESRVVATAVAPEPAHTADLDATLDLATPQVATDAKTQESLPGGRMVTPAAKRVRRPPRPPVWKDRRTQIAAGAGGLLLVLLGIWVVVRDKGGKEIARVAVPEGGSATIVEDGKVVAERKATTGKPSATAASKPSRPTPPLVADGTAAGWTTLFSGRDLSGWTPVGANGWSVRDGVLTGDGNGRGWLMSPRDYADLELAFEYRLPLGGNSGVFVHAWPEGNEVTGKKFVEIQLLDDTAPDYANLGPTLRTAALYRTVAPQPTPRCPANQWHRMEIRVQGRQIQVSVNGTRVLDAILDAYAARFAECPGLTRKTGRIGFQLLDTRVEFRNVRLRELPETVRTGDVPPVAKPVPPWPLPAGAPPPAIAPFAAAKAKEYQAAWAKYLGVEVESENSVGIRFVLIPPGEFDMGSTEAEVAKLLEQAKAKNQPSWYIERLPSEAPKHRVRITKPFYLAASEVTQAQYQRVVGNNPSNFKDDPACPVEMVSWDDA